jgi:methylenetetrahydrofolate dehydrogenase (NADP+)/methenyltetrahydrofolate cyclohydrolase
MLKILDGKIIRDEIVTKLKSEIESFKIKPILAILQIGDLEESNKYIKAKKTFAEKIGAEVRHIQFADTISQNEIIVEIQRLNQDETVQGIILQLPIPKNLNSLEIIETIDPRKDVDGLTLLTKFVPATARGVLTLLYYYQIDIAGKKVVVMGRSKLVGQPVAKILENRGAEVSVVHSQTESPKEITKLADILIVAIGKAQLVDDSYVSPGQIVIDIGINFKNFGLLEEINLVEHNRQNHLPSQTQDSSLNKEESSGKPTATLFGDVDFEKVKDIVSAITPVPGGIGPLTVASLFENLVEAYKNQL